MDSESPWCFLGACRSAAPVVASFDEVTAEPEGQASLQASGPWYESDISNLKASSDSNAGAVKFVKACAVLPGRDEAGGEELDLDERDDSEDPTSPSSMVTAKMQVRCRVKPPPKEDDVPRELEAKVTALKELEGLWLDIIAKLPKKPPAESSVDEDDRTFPINWDVEGSELWCDEMRAIGRFDLARFLVARSGDAKAAAKLASYAAVWYAAVRPRQVKYEQISVPISHACWRFAGWSKCGYPVVVSTSEGWKPWEYHSADEYARFAGYVGELMRLTHFGKGVKKFILISDLEGFTMNCCRPIAMRCLMCLDFVLQEMFAERIASLIMVNTGSFRFGWPIFRPLCQPHVRRTLRWLSPTEQKPYLESIIDLSTLESRYGGNYEGLHPSFTGYWDVDAAFGANAPEYDPTALDPSL
ncbi:unnamed protein product [Polarella glacialis]|uniref:CRAL-TRIO domain-containing protein n=1 Tax=Polarella glacialis TaxID=89957 RepID=A0A813DNW5_POLGL|nr:unnamed protein product [Polarella glacialis]